MNLLKLFIKYQLNGVKYKKQAMSACYSVSVTAFNYTTSLPT